MPGLHEQTKAACPFVLEKTRPSRAQSPRGPQRHTEVWKPTGDTSQYKARSPPLLSSFLQSLRGQKAVQPRFLHHRGEKPGFSSSHLLFPSNSSRRRVAASRSSHQGNLLATQALSTSKPRRDVLQENFKQQLSWTTQQNHEGRSHPTSKTISGLNNHTRLSKTVYSILCIVYKFDLWCCDIVILWEQVIWKLMLVMLLSLSLHASSNFL